MEYGTIFIIIATIFEFLGAFLAGGQVTSTIRKGILDTTQLVSTPDILVYGMLASLLAAGIWLMVASRFGWPVSTTHSIVGAIVGFAAIGVDMDIVKWGKIGTIVSSWVVSPLLAGSIAYALFYSVQRLILDKAEPLKYAKRYVPYYIFLVGFMIALVTLYKGNFDPDADLDFHYTNVEKIFTVLMVFTACAMAFAHGSNDVANAIGPLAAVISIVENGGEVAQKSTLPVWVLILGGGGIVIGLVTYGHKVIATVGTGITKLTPSSGFAATLAAATTVVLASRTGLPISTTHTLVGAVLGVGVARGIAALNLKVIRTIFMSWVITLPAGAILSIIIFYILKAIFS
jgi:PiT family inorganic phosphate transporter